MEGQLVSLACLPTKGIKYPEDIEIYVKPLSTREQMDMDRFGISQAEYYQILLNGITIRGDFDKNDLFFYDVHFLDLIRRLYTFDVEEEIRVKDYPCSNPYCTGKIDVSFLTHELECTDIPEDIYDKEYTFSDGLTVVIYPLTIRDFLSMSREYITNKEGKVSDTLLAYFAYCTKDVKDRTFKDRKHMLRFLMDYYGSLCKHKDAKILRDIETKTVSSVKPIKVICPKCGENMEVEVTPSMTFWQDEDI